MVTDPEHGPADAADFVLGVDFGGTKVALATAAVEGEILQTTRLQTNATDGAAQALERSLDAARALIDDTAGRCVAVGAVSPGIVKADRVLLAPNVPGWDALALPDALREGLEIDSVAVGNDVKAAALAEARWGSLRGADPGLLVILGTGVAA